MRGCGGEGMIGKIRGEVVEFDFAVVGADDGKAIFPDDGGEESFAAEVFGGGAAVGTCGEEDHPPSRRIESARGRRGRKALDGIIFAEVAVGEDGVSVIGLVRAGDGFGAGDGDGMFGAGAALSDHQIIVAIHFVIGCGASRRE